jgi:hypothetical protein
VAVVVVGVAVPEVGVSVRAISAGLLSVMIASPMSVGAVPPRRGERSSNVVAGCRLREDTVSDGIRCRPARRIRTSAGRLVEAERKSRTSEMEFEGRTFNGMAVGWRIYQWMFHGEAGCLWVGLLFPPPILTKIWTLSAGSDEAEDVDDDRERMVTVIVG